MGGTSALFSLRFRASLACVLLRSTERRSLSPITVQLCNSEHVGALSKSILRCHATQGLFGEPRNCGHPREHQLRCICKPLAISNFKAQ
jgi:hypothetical protein